MTGYMFLLPMIFAGSGEQEPSAEKVLQMALKQRQAIKQFAGTFKFVREEAIDKGKKNANTFMFALDGNKLRQDRIEANNVKEVKCRNCEKEGQFIRFINSEPSGSRVYLEYGTMPGNGKRGDGNYSKLFLTDPRVFGLFASRAGHMYAHSLDALLDSTDRTQPKMEKAKWNGKEAYIVRFAAKSGPKAAFAYWIVPTMDYSVVQCELQSEDSDGEKYAASLKCELEKYGKNGVWFPKSYIAEGSTGAKNLWRENMELSNVTINEALPADTFKLASMKIPVGWPIYGSATPDKGKRYEWDGRKMIERNPPKAKNEPKEMSSAPTSGPSRGILLAGAGSLALAGTVALGFYFGKRRNG